VRHRFAVRGRIMDEAAAAARGMIRPLRARKEAGVLAGVVI